MNALVLIYATFADSQEAERIAMELLHDKLIVCANILPKVNSMYLWEGKINNSNEAVAIMKSRSDLTDRIIERVEARHSYSQPVVAVISIAEANKSFIDWVNIGV
ncbi:cation tolerance protein [Wolbachia pipientis]|uniref:Cation tolerance protein n=1 Tax=Wolbachia pipientis TaxID=955 RepID=A0A1E7QIX9_WOLPI|nr:divalent-cation tolerance protein CutA [Wolbachia pipientis]OEY86431.1 cation tolerance protein [Wolbachia pipientis]